MQKKVGTVTNENGMGFPEVCFCTVHFFLEMKKKGRRRGEIYIDLDLEHYR